MYHTYLPDLLPKNWAVAELDEDNGYLEFLGYDGEFLVSVMEDSYENPDTPYHLCMNQMKGIIGRYDFDQLDWPEWFKDPEEAVNAALKLMIWMNQNYSDFLPLAMEILVSIGTKDQLQVIEQYFTGELKIHDFNGQTLVFKKVCLLGGSNSYEESAKLSLSDFTLNSGLSPKEMKGGLLTNEKFELIEDLRSVLKD